MPILCPLPRFLSIATRKPGVEEALTPGPGLGQDPAHSAHVGIMTVEETNGADPDHHVAPDIHAGVCDAHPWSPSADCLV